MPNDLGQAQRFAVAAMADRGKDFLQRPFALNPQLNGLSRNAEFIGPFAQVQCSSIQRHPMVVRAIVLLDLHGSPSAIARLVAARIVDAVNRMGGGWLWPHVRQKALKVPPFRRDRNALGAIFGVQHGRRIFATLPDIDPGDVLGSSGSTVRRIALNALFPMNVDIETAARARMPRLQDSSPDRPLDSTLASAKPAGDSGAIVLGAALNKPPPEALTAKVLKLWHSLGYHTPYGMTSHG